MKCNFCGQEHDGSSGVCPRCGHPLDSAPGSGLRLSKNLDKAASTPSGLKLSSNLTQKNPQPIPVPSGIDHANPYPPQSAPVYPPQPPVPGAAPVQPPKNTAQKKQEQSSQKTSSKLILWICLAAVALIIGLFVLFFATKDNRHSTTPKKPATHATEKPSASTEQAPAGAETEVVPQTTEPMQTDDHGSEILKEHKLIGSWNSFGDPLNDNMLACIYYFELYEDGTLTVATAGVNSDYIYKTLNGGWQFVSEDSNSIMIAVWFDGIGGTCNLRLEKNGDSLYIYEVDGHISEINFGEEYRIGWLYEDWLKNHVVHGKLNDKNRLTNYHIYFNENFLSTDLVCIADVTHDGLQDMIVITGADGLDEVNGYVFTQDSFGNISLIYTKFGVVLGWGEKFRWYLKSTDAGCNFGEEVGWISTGYGFLEFREYYLSETGEVIEVNDYRMSEEREPGTGRITDEVYDEYAAHASQLVSKFYTLFASLGTGDSMGQYDMSPTHVFN